MRILSKKMKPKSKKGVSWNQGGRNRKLVGKAIADGLEIMKQMKQPIAFPTEENVASEVTPVEEKMKMKKNSTNSLTDKLLIQELVKRIKAGTIKIDLSFYEYIIGLSCSDYQWRFPDDWKYPYYYQVVTGPDGKVTKFT